MVLGPSCDHRGERWPLEMRRDVAKMFRERKCPAVLMEDVETVAGESMARKFARIVEEYNVRTFVIAWPKACRLNGLDIELGFLLERMVSRTLDPHDVKLLTHDGNIRVDQEGNWSLGEQGNRTRYYDSFLDEGCTVRLFESARHLELNIISLALDHHQRHIARLDERSFVGETAKKLKAKATARQSASPPAKK